MSLNYSDNNKLIFIYYSNRKTNLYIDEEAEENSDFIDENDEDAENDDTISVSSDDQERPNKSKEKKRLIKSEECVIFYI